MSKCSGEHQHSWGKEGHAHGHGTMWYEGDPNKLHHHHDIICLRAKDAEIASLRAEIGNSEAVRLGMEKKIADLKDGLTAAHMDGFASGKAEAKEMLRKRDGQLEELRAEVKAYREVEDSLQKEIKRLDAEVERLKALENKMGSGWALVEYEKVQARAEQAEKAHDALHKQYSDLDVAMREAEKELAECRGKVEKQYELIDFYDAKVAAVMKWRESAYIPNDSDENELKRILLGE